MTDATHAAPAARRSGQDFGIYRIWGAAFAAIFLILFAIQVFELFDNDNRTVPEIRWAAPPISEEQTGSSSLVATDMLQERALLQGPRAQFGPSPGNERTFQVGPGTVLDSSPIDTPDPFLTESWSRPSDDTLPMIRGSEDVAGISSLPYVGAAQFERPFARDWRLGIADVATHLGALAILGFACLLALVLTVFGRVPIARGKSGRTVQRFGFFERLTHWMTAVSFLALALTGIVIAYGDTLILPFGEAVLGEAGWLAMWGHMMFFPPFAIGVALMLVIWIRHNVPSRLDLNWLAKGGGLFSENVHPSARKFNAGQKLIFWSVIFGGGLMVVTGLLLMFPFWILSINGMGWAMLAHAVIGALLIAVILGHIYIGSVGMQGAFWAMWTGRVDLNWAAEHHDLWLEEIDGKRRNAR